MRTLVLGMGNPILCDDAVGIRLARDLRSRLETVPEAGPGRRLHRRLLRRGAQHPRPSHRVRPARRIRLYPHVRGRLPDNWHEMTGETFRETMNLGCVHDANFTTALELGRQMGAYLPTRDNVHIFAVEIVDNTTFSESMTPELEAAYNAFCPEIMRQALALLRS